MKNQKGVSLIALIITIIVIIVLAAIVMQSSTGTVDEANFAGFAQEVGDYTSAVTTSAASIKADAAVEGVIINDAQKNYMLANGVKAADVKSKAEVFGMLVPAGYKLETPILTPLGYTDEDVADIAIYEIKDDKYVDGYKSNFEFYGDSNGTEKHYVTSDGTVFTLPGFPQTQEDRTIRYYITPTAYYTVKGNGTTGEDTPYQHSDLDAFTAIKADSRGVGSGD